MGENTKSARDKEDARPVIEREVGEIGVDEGWRNAREKQGWDARKRGGQASFTLRCGGAELSERDSKKELAGSLLSPSSRLCFFPFFFFLFRSPPL